MESPKYTMMYAQAIQSLEESEELKNDPERLKQVQQLRSEAEEKQNQDIRDQICGDSFESKYYRMLVDAGFIKLK